MIRRTLVAVGLVAGLATMVTACGQQPSESTGDKQASVGTSDSVPETTSATTSSPGLSTGGISNKCVAANLKGTVHPLDSAAGHRHAELVVTNTSDTACTLYGYGGLELVGANGKATPTTLTRQADPGPALVSLKPGGTAAKRLSWGVVPTGNEPVTGLCEPESTGARVVAPDDTSPFTVTFHFGSVCAGGAVEGSAYYKH